MGRITKLGDQKTIIASGYAKTNELKTAQELGLESILSAKYQKKSDILFYFSIPESVTRSLEKETCGWLLKGIGNTISVSAS
jgi:hypothetical protein